MVATYTQVKITSQINVFMISATYIVCHLKLVCLIVLVKEIIDIYLNNIYRNIFSVYLVRKYFGEHRLYALASNKRSQNFTKFHKFSNT